MPAQTLYSSCSLSVGISIGSSTVSKSVILLLTVDENSSANSSVFRDEENHFSVHLSTGLHMLSLNTLISSDRVLLGSWFLASATNVFEHALISSIVGA